MELNIVADDGSVDCLDGVVSCKVVTRADHTRSTDRSADVKVPIHWAGQPPLVEEPEPEPPAPLTLSATQVRAGETITVTGEGFTPEEQVQVWIHSEPRFLDVVTADADGVATATVTIPLDIEPGEHHLEMRGITSGLVVRSEAFTVLAAAAGPASGQAPDPAAPAIDQLRSSPGGTGTLPRTGGELSLVGLGLGLVVAGGVALWFSRRSRTLEVTR